MNSDWKEYRIEDIAADTPHSMSTGPFGSAVSSKFFQEQGVPVIRGGNLSTNITERMSDDGLVFVSSEKAKEFKRSVVRAGDLIFTCWGTINQVGLITNELKYSEYIISNKQMKLTVDTEKADPLFLYYLFSSPLKQSEILNNGIGAAVPGFNLGQLKNHSVFLPPVNEQRRISAILNAFDKKIRHNGKTNQTLEHIAQALFKSWFVDFEPTRAKIAAKQAGQDSERAAMAAISGKTLAELDQLDAAQLAQLKTTAALFPDGLVESELGEVPEGWSASPLSSMVELIGGGTPKKSESNYWNGDIPWFSVKDAPADGDVFVIDTELKITELGLNKSSTKLLPEGITIISARGTVGRLALVGTKTAMNQSCYGVRGIDGIGAYLNYFNLKEAVSTLQQNTHGAVFDTITKATFETVFLVNASDDVKSAFEKTVEASFRQIKNNLFENKSLETLRNTLPPKLLSGELSPTTTEAA